MRNYLYPLFIFIGLALGWLFPFYALSLSRWAFLFLFFLLVLNIFPVELKLKSILTHNQKDRYFIFFSYFFLPSFVYVISLFLKTNESIRLGFFMTALAPFAIIAPQFLKAGPDKQLALKHILTSTFLFPIYFTFMLFLFFPKNIQFNIFSIVLDSFILTALPIIITLIFNQFFADQKILIQKNINRFLPILNMFILGTLGFIFIGSSFLKNDLSSFTLVEWISIVFLAFFQDFGVYAISKLFNFETAYRTTIAMKNVAFVGTFALIFYPKALLPIIAILVAHAILFLYFSFDRREKPHLIN